MQSLLVQVATTFVGDTVAFVKGFGRIVAHLVMAPVERIAKACDVAGLLAERAARAVEREQAKRAWRSLSYGTMNPHRSRRHGGWFGCLRSLGELTWREGPSDELLDRQLDVLTAAQSRVSSQMTGLAIMVAEEARETAPREDLAAEASETIAGAHLAMGVATWGQSCFSLAKKIRDVHEANRVINRVEEART